MDKGGVRFVLILFWLAVWVVPAPAVADTGSLRGIGNDSCSDSGVSALNTPNDFIFDEIDIPNDPFDCWQFTLTATSDLDISLLLFSSADLDINLRTASELLIASSTNIGAITESIIVSNLPAGTYFIEVFPKGINDSADYELLFGSNTANGADDNDFCFGPDVSSLATPSDTVSESVGSPSPNDPIDCWRFDLSEISDVELNLSGLSDDLDIRLSDDNFNVIDTSTNSGSVSETLSATNLTVGTYYIEVLPKDGEISAYTLDFSASPVIVSDGNDSPDDSGVITLVPGDIISDSVGGSDPTDFWRIRLVGARSTVFQVAVSIRDLTDNLDLFLTRSGESGPIASSTSPGTLPEFILIGGLVQGIYNLEVRPVGGAQSTYTLEYNVDTSTAALGNISYSGFVAEIIRPAFIQAQTAEVIITAETLGLPDPQISLKKIEDSSTVAFNDNCDEPDIEQLLDRPLGSPSVDACIVQILDPGAYFFEVTGNGAQASGNVLAGVTQTAGSNPALLNISYNGFVSPEGIKPAFILLNSDRIIITAESLGLPDPQVALKRLLDGSTVAANDDCDVVGIDQLIGQSLKTALDACLVLDDLAVDAYFIEVSDVDGNSGNALVGATQVPAE